MCAVFGVWNVNKAAEVVAVGLHGLQHRAIDYAGIVSSDGANLYRERGAGLTRQVFSKAMLDRLHGKHAVGHIRYPTVTDDQTRDNIQPIVGLYDGSGAAVAHNGNITNVQDLVGAHPDLKLSTSLDTEYILQLLKLHCTGDIEADLATVFRKIKGSYALGILLPDRLIAVRDPSGNRPLSIGSLNGGFVISSETCAFPTVGAKYLFDVEPGSMATIGSGTIHKTSFAEPAPQKCRFESIYFAHPSSVVFKEPVADFRLRLGAALEEHCPAVGADIITPIPDSSTFIAMGYSQSGRSGKYFPVIIRSHYVGRSFLAATQTKRDVEVAQKFAFTETKIRGRKIVVVDDSIVRGTTLPKIVSVLRELGAREIHVRIGSPPIKHPCKYGINTPTTEELLSARLSASEICTSVGADSLEFLPLEVLQQLSPSPEHFCFACMNGTYW